MPHQSDPAVSSNQTVERSAADRLRSIVGGRREEEAEQPSEAVARLRQRASQPGVQPATPIRRFEEAQDATRVVGQAPFTPGEQQVFQHFIELGALQDALEIAEDEEQRSQLEARISELEQAIEETPAEAKDLTRFDSQTGKPQTRPLGTLDRLRQARDRLLNQTLANNPIQQAASVALTPLANALGDAPSGSLLPVQAARTLNFLFTGRGVSEEATEARALDIIENIGQGSAIGSVLIPDDAAADPQNPMPALQLAGVLAGATAEGFAADLSILRGLQVVATTKKGTNLGRSAEAALRGFGLGQDMSVARQIVGGAALGTISEAGLQTAALQDPEQIISAAGLVGVAGGALGGSIAAVSVGRRAAVSTPRALRAFAEEFTEAGARTGKPPIVAAAESSSQFDVAAKTPLSESGIGSQTEEIARRVQAVRQADDARVVAAKPSSGETTRLPEVRLQDETLEAMFDVGSPRTLLERFRDGFESATETFQKSFVFESAMRRFPSLSGLDELTLADDFRLLKTTFDRAPRLAVGDLREITAPITKFKGGDFRNAFRGFERIVFLRDLVETAERGLDVPLGRDLQTLRSELARLEAQMPKEVLEAAERHRQVVNRMREELIRRGKLEVGDGYENYVPHVVIEDLARADARVVGDIDPDALRFYGAPPTREGPLKEPIRQSLKRRLGSTKVISTDYAQLMYRAIRRFHVDNAIDDFLEDIDKALGLKRADLTDGEKAALDKVGRFKRGDEEFKAFTPTGPTYYRTQSVDDQAYATLRSKVQEGLGVDIEDIPDLKNTLSVGRRKEYLLPRDIAERLERFYLPDPLRATVFNPLRVSTAWWKRNTIHWGLSRFFVFQILGDGTNLLRSNPQALVQLKNGRLDSPTFRAVAEIFKRYGTPLMSGDQAASAAAGGFGGHLVTDALNSDDPSVVDRAATILVGAGLGYMLGTKRLAAGTRRTVSDVYDTADRLGAINSGFFFQTEELNRRILGERAASLPTKAESAWRRSLDTVATVLSGKPTGDPFNLFFARDITELVEVVQQERENVLRLASYMQQVESGVHPRLAAKRATEALVDYGKFTDFENKFLRGFLLPFYGFHRHNIPNWIKAAVGRDVGGKATVGLVAAAGIASFDIASQAWNETFFPEIERRLPEWQRERFHLIAGNPATREPLTDKNGKPIVVGWEMPYEEALELFGLARPGYVLSQLFGIAGELDGADLVERGRRTAEDLARLKPVRDFTVDLLTPIIKEPIQAKMNEDFFYDAPIVPERYVGTEQGREALREHVVGTFFRQYREAKRTASELEGRRFDPLTSAFGLGLPVSSVDLDRSVQGFLHESMQESADREQRQQATWKKPLDDLIYGREDFSRIEEDEIAAAQGIISNNAVDPLDAQAAWRYYMNRGSKGSLIRHWQSLSTRERLDFWNRLPDWGKTAFFYYMNGGTSLEESLQLPGIPSVAGN